MMNCEHFTASISDYMEGRMSTGERMGIFAHSLMCKHCRRFKRQLQVVVKLAGLPDTNPERRPVTDEDALVAAFTERHRPT
jgi:anti-sigma factor ChrR (cupin superfamily)